MTARKIVEENFEGLGELIKDKDLLEWYKSLIVVCIQKYGDYRVIQYKKRHGTGKKVDRK